MACLNLHVSFGLCVEQGLVDDQLLVEVGAEEASEGIFLHQSEDPLLSQVKSSRGEVDQTPQSHVFGEVVNVHLQTEESIYI